MASLNPQRREQILDALLQSGFVGVTALRERLAVSEATVRRALHQLAREGLLELVHGGATLPKHSDFSFDAKARRNVDAKRVIGQLAAGLVADRESVLLDSGTTIFEMVRHLKSRRSLTIITNSARFAVELGGAPDSSIFLIGGQYRPDRMDSVGPVAVSMLEQLRGYRAFVGSDGLSPDFGLTAGDPESAHFYQIAIRNAREVTLLVDHTKFQASSLFRICGFEPISTVITDRLPSKEWLAFFSERGIRLITPDSAPSAPSTDSSPGRRRMPV